ncbi:MAG: hypothetical protein QM770_24010 [Tepidisphaeraceae bacterium]
MSERMVISAWHFSMLGLLFLATLVGLTLAYAGVYGVLTGELPGALARLLASVTLAGLIFWIARHRDELVEG